MLGGGGGGGEEEEASNVHEDFAASNRTLSFLDLCAGEQVAVILSL